MVPGRKTEKRSQKEMLLRQRQAIWMVPGRKTEKRSQKEMLLQQRGLGRRTWYDRTSGYVQSGA